MDLCALLKKLFTRDLLTIRHYWRGMRLGFYTAFSMIKFRGQVMNAEMLSNVVDVELLYEGVKYVLKVPCILYSVIIMH